ncbi:MAG: hypothetical protein AB1775_14335 [Bacteroidota bacterium]
MRKVLLILVLITLPMFAQNVTVVEDKPVTSLREGRFYFPTISPDGSSLLYTKDNYQGLWSRNLKTEKTIKVSSALSAGYEPSFDETSGEIIFREDQFIKGKRTTSLNSFNTSNKVKQVLEKGIRDLRICRSPQNIFQSYVNDTNAPVRINKGMSVQTTVAQKTVYVDGNHITVSDNSSKKELQPMGEGNYIWVSLSPDKTKLLFTFAGKGTYVSDLDGNILKVVGYANYPSWSADGNWILFMKDLDDGVKVTSSNIYIVNYYSGKYYKLTSGENNIKLYPTWGTSNSKIFYNTDNGQIRELLLRFE